MADNLIPPAATAWLDGLPAPAVIVRGEGFQPQAIIEQASAEFGTLTGHRPEELVGRELRLLHGPRTDPARLRAATTGRPAETWLVRKDGSEFFARWKTAPIAGQPGRTLVLFQDHTESWKQREALLQSQKLGTLGLLTGGVAHDFNNLLSIINGYCEILGPKLEDRPEVRKELEEMHRAGLKAAALARQVLEFSRRRESGDGVINFNTLIREIAEILRRACGELITVELRLASGLGNARFNPIHFQQVLLNLCFNARDAMPDGGRLALRTSTRPATALMGATVMLEVTDTGPGIPLPLQTRIFEPFFTTKEQGTGLGLPASLGLVQAAGGTLTFRSELGRGTTFAVALPETLEPEELGTAALGTLPSSQGSESVLVVERDLSLRKMVAGILNTDGYSVTEGASIEEALARPIVPQLVIADTTSPAGVARLRQLAETNKALRMISTASEKPDLPLFTRGTGVHLPKPFALSTLLTKARTLLDTPANL